MCIVTVAAAAVHSLPPVPRCSAKPQIVVCHGQQQQQRSRSDHRTRSLPSSATQPPPGGTDVSHLPPQVVVAGLDTSSWRDGEKTHRFSSIHHNVTTGQEARTRERNLHWGCAAWCAAAGGGVSVGVWRWCAVESPPSPTHNKVIGQPVVVVVVVVVAPVLTPMVVCNSL